MKLFLKAVGALCLLALAGCSYALPEINVPYVSSPPTIDGVLNDPVWEKAAVISEFVDIATGTPTSPKTTCRIMQDADNLYVAYVCYDPDTSSIIKNTKQHDGTVWQDDCVELFLNPQGDRKGYFHFIINPAGVKYEDHDGNAVWDRYWLVKTSVSRECWNVEIQIPFASVGISKNSLPSSTWVANFNRKYCVKNSENAVLSGWAPTNTPSFIVPTAFGSLKGIRVLPSDYCRNGEVIIKSPAKWYLGSNRVAVNISSAAPKGSKIRIVGFDVNSEKEMQSRIVDLKPGSQTVNVDIPVKTASPTTLQFVAFDGKTGRVLGSSQDVNVEISPRFETVLANPCFRNSFQSRDPKKEIYIRGYVAYSEKKNLSVRATLKSNTGNTSFWNHKVAVKTQSDFVLRKAIKLPSPGDYMLLVELVGASGKAIESTRYPIHVLPPASFEVTFDERHICYVNGKPFFPMALYHTGNKVLDIINMRSKEIGLPGDLTVDSMLRDVKAHGFNTSFWSWGMASEEYIQKAQDLGLYVVPEVGSASAEEIARYVVTANKFNNLLMWYGRDEPADATLPGAIAAYENYCKLDPHRPVSAAVCFPQVIKLALQAFDFIMIDPYLITAWNSTGDLAAIGQQWMKSSFEVSRERVPVWGIPQAFTLSDYRMPAPTYAQLRCQAYEYIANGATGLFWYAYWTGEQYKDNPTGRNQWCITESPTWDHFSKLNPELNDFTKIVLYGGLVDGGKYSVKSDRPLSTRIWDYQGSRYLLAVNAWNQPVSAAFKGTIKGRIGVQYENRAITPKGGVFEDQFEPLAVHIYKFKP